MKKKIMLMFISLVAMPFCKAADYSGWESAFRGLTWVERHNQELIIKLYFNEPCFAKEVITHVPKIDLPYLKELWLGNNRLTTLTAILQLSAPGLKFIDLSDNRITSIKAAEVDELLKKFPKLQELYLQDFR